MGIISKIFGTHSQREINKIKPIVNKILDLDDKMSKLTPDELKEKTVEFKKRLANGETLDDILVEAFAVARAAAALALGMKPYPVQVMGGIILHQGRLAEMKTGEGKTLVATMPAYLNALKGKGVHIVTVNDYLAKRDSEQMGQVYSMLGLTTGVVLSNYEPYERREAYACDITYVTNNELGFDYLRDNMVVEKKDLVLRDLNYCIIDEVDSVLIDEARTPLIISGQSSKSTKLYEFCDYLAKTLERGEASGEMTKMAAIMGEEITETGDFVVNEKDKVVNLTEEGVQKVEKYFKIENLADPENLEIQHNIILALRANNLMFKDKDYIVKDGEILIVDEFTGRIMPGRRYSDGLHQAIEAKERVEVRRESRTLATITFQNFFNKFAKKAGMTGTALTEEQEFRNIYFMDVIEIPTNKPVIRKDHNDAVFINKKGKLKAIINQIEECHKKGQPVLVGTISIESSEEISSILKRHGIKHEVLNAKQHEREAEIVALAGRFKSVTIATNMAGRGTDIKLDQEAKDAGGLFIVGTERHESRRIDNQLRGRSGRQGDPGESKFFISLEDDLMRLFSNERMISIFKSLGVEEDEEIQHNALTSAVEKAQKKIEGNNFGVRKNLLEYDRVNNEQRESIYEERRKVLDGENMKDLVMKMIEDVISQKIDIVYSEDNSVDIKELYTLITPIIPFTNENINEACSGNKDEAKARLLDIAKEMYQKREEMFPEEMDLREVERVVILRVIDEKWMNHIDDMDQLREGIGLQAYGQKDPLVEYKVSGYEMFSEMIQAIFEQVINILFNMRVNAEVSREENVKVTGTNRDDTSVKQPKVRKDEKVYPNSTCPCGSGKKYKHCCGAK